MTQTLVHVLVLLLLPPLLPGFINKTKALFAGRRGPPLLQPYRDIVKLLRKGLVLSETTTWVFRAGPVVTLAAVAIILLWMKYFNDLCKAMGRRFGWLLGLLMFIPQVGLFVVDGGALASASRDNKSQSMPR